jgi:hypothetical protein
LLTHDAAQRQDPVPRDGAAQVRTKEIGVVVADPETGAQQGLLDALR